MSAQPCLPQDIIEVNRNKEYTLISTNLLESVLTDTRLNAQTTKLWQILFNYARFNPNFEIKISYGYLAKKLGKSERTISRYVELLQDTGYLLVKHNFDKNGGQRPSTISVRVPEETIEHTKKKKDRHNKNGFNNTETSIIEANDCYNQSELTYRENPENVTEPQFSSNNSNVLCGTDQNNEQVQATNQPLDRIEINNLCSRDEEDCDLISSTLQDKNDGGGDDINVLHKDNNKKDINKNNNNNVVPFFKDKEQITAIQNEINILEQQLAEGDKQLTSIKDHEQLYGQIKKNSRIQAALHLSRIALEKKYREIEENTKQQKTDLELKTNPILILNKAGERVLPTFTFKRLINSLKSYGYGGNSLNVLINEIVFEARFGSLIKCNKTKSALSVDKAINIALKLVREKRWSSPVMLKN
ncbi:MAG: helix-turn-helix domain-containing protein [Gammaproteobacteria bacterium]